jgi:hypothetical protein
MRKSTSIHSLECGRTLCRLEIDTTADDVGGRQTKIRLAKMAIPIGELALRMSAPPMPPKVVAYIARENTRLSSMFGVEGTQEQRDVPNMFGVEGLPPRPSE